MIGPTLDAVGQLIDISLFGLRGGVATETETS